MNKSINFSLDTSKMVVDVQSKNFDVFNGIVSEITSYTENTTLSKNKFQLNWQDFKLCIRGIHFYAKKGNISLIFDHNIEKYLQKLVNDIKSFNEKTSYFDLSKTQISEILNNVSFLRDLTQSQLRDVESLLRLRHGANFSVPGAGKTTSLLAVYSILRYFGVLKYLFVISPLNAFIAWEDEINQILPHLSTKLIRLEISSITNFQNVNLNQKEIFLVNYEKLRRDISIIFPFFQKESVHLVLDESHKIKSGYENQSFQQIVRLSDFSTRRDILSGTPMPQDPNDLRPQFDFLWGYDLLKMPFDTYDEKTKLDFYNKQIAGKFVRTTKSELGLKKPRIKYTRISMGPIQEEIYSLLKSEIARKIKKLDNRSKEYFRRMGNCSIRLLQVATNPLLVTNDFDTDDFFDVFETPDFISLFFEFKKNEIPSKINYLSKRIKRILDHDPNKKIVIWTYFVKNIILLSKLFQQYDPVLIYGKIPTGDEKNQDTREYNIRKFHNESSCRIMIANPQAGGEGISLHKICHNAIYLDRNFNAAYYLQSLDRIHRLGLDPTVETNIEILISENTIDELLIKRLNKKISNMGSILNDSQLITLAYDPEDFTDEDYLGLDMVDIQTIQEHIFQE